MEFLQLEKMGILYGNVMLWKQSYNSKETNTLLI